MRALSTILFFVATTACYSLKAQEIIPDSLERDTPDDESYQEGIHEDLLSGSFESSDETQTSEMIDFYRLHPVDLNRASLLELENIPGLGAVMAKKIHDYREIRPFSQKSDLKSVPGLTDKVYSLVKDMVTAGKEAQRRTSVDMRQRTVRNLDTPVNSYRGDPYQLYHRLEIRHLPYAELRDRAVTAGVVFEKDAGETRWNDHQSVYAEIRNFPLIRQATAGHYQLEFGQGLVLWGGRGSVKGSEVTQAVKKSGRGIRRFSYASETGALFGGAVHLDAGGSGWTRNLEPTVFYSAVRLDASLNDDGTIRSLKTDGFHRDSAELDKESVLAETIWGANVDYRFGVSSIGVTFYEDRFDRTFVLMDTVRSRYNFTGRRNRVAGAHYDLFVAGVNVFGEIAVAEGHRALNSGILWGKGGLEGALLYRNYARSFLNFHASGFGEQSGGSQNEEGIYVGLGYRIRRGTHVRMYYDVFRYPWRSYEVPARVRGDDGLIQWEQSLTSDVQSIVRFKHERKDIGVATTDIFGRDIRVVERADTRRVRVQVDWKVLPDVRLRSRAEGVRYRVPNFKSLNEEGSSFYQDIRWHVNKTFTLFGRWTVFDTDGSASAVYEYENDVDGVFTNSLFTDQGSRWYLAAKVRWKKHLTVFVKYWERYRETPASPADVIRRAALSLAYGF